MRDKKIPLRKCVGCGESKSKKDLIRVVKSKDGIIDVDLTGKKNGRGAYICSNDCIKVAKKNKKLNIALGAQVPDEIYDRLFKLVKETEL